MAFGKRYIVQALPKLADRYLDLDFEVHLSDRYTDLIEERIDASVRVGHSPDSQLIIYPLAQAQLMVCATPDYWQKHGKPETLEDLGRHNCLNFIVPNTNRVRHWAFESDGEKIQLPFTGNFSFSNPEAMLENALAGIGVVQLYNFLVYPAIAKGFLEPVLEIYAPPTVPLSIIYPQKRHLSAKVRVFVEFMRNIVADLKKQGFAI
ncbi:MAG: substrate binding domain-containing protein [Cyanobacteria bacterium P01_G01_bin.39]